VDEYPVRARREKLVPTFWDEHPRFVVWLVFIVVVFLAWLIRAISISINYEIFIDEVTYARIADNLATGKGVTLYGAPFDLHPPAVFALYALVIKLFGLHGGIASIVLALRPVSALIGATTCGVVFLLVRGLVNWRAGLIAASIVALDPFEIFYDSRVLLEAPAMLGSSIAILLLVRATQTPGRRSWTLVVLGGLAAGFTICAKEYFGFTLGLTLLLCLITGWVIERGKAAVALAIMCGSYVLSESLVINATGFQPWWQQVSSGTARLVGSSQITGFNSSTVHVSLLSRVAANATHFGTTYVILAFGAVAAGWQVITVFRQRRAEGRILGRLPSYADRGRLLVALWAIGAALYLVYATGFGTLEAQMYYLLLAPAICVLVLYAAQTIRYVNTWWIKAAAAVLVAAVLVIDSAVWVAVHRTPDDEYRQLLAWAPTHMAEGSHVSVTEFTAEFLLNGYVLGEWSTIASLKQHHVDYVLLSTNLVTQGYGLGRPAFLEYLQEHAKVAFQANGPSEGSLILYDVRGITGAR